MNGYTPWTLAEQRQAALDEYIHSAREVTISRDDYDHLLALMRTGSTFQHKDLMVEGSTLRVSMSKAAKILEQYI
jgi:hypothetical protein